MTISDGICAYVAGGLGNQLFQLAAGWEQAERLECPLYLETSDFRVRRQFAFELDSIEHPGHVLESSPWTAVRVPGGRVLPAPAPRLPLRRRVHLERNPDAFDPAIDRVKVGTTLFGYFQSPRYFPTIAPTLATAIQAAPIDDHERETLDRFAGDPRITVHLRRGDYLSAPPGRQVVATAAYASRAIRLLRDLGLDAPIRIFSDSPALVAEELQASGLDDDFELVGPDAGLSALSTIRAMSAGLAIVTSNSSFSWWAAWLARQHRSDVRVISPRPWNESGTAKADLVGSDWIGLDAR